MSKQIEAMKLALEALEEIHPGNMTPIAEEAWNKAITALREAQAEQPAQPQQEPVACKTLCELCVKRGYRFCANAAQTTPIPSPPAQRTWVGLTDEEMNAALDYWSEDERSAYGGAHAADGEYVSMIDTWRYIEAKLKEKNHG